MIYRLGTAHYSDEGNGFVALCLVSFGIAMAKSVRVSYHRVAVTVKLARVSYHVAAAMAKPDQVVCGCRYGKAESDQATAESHFVKRCTGKVRQISVLVEWGVVISCTIVTHSRKTNPYQPWKAE